MSLSPISSLIVPKSETATAPAGEGDGAEVGSLLHERAHRVPHAVVHVPLRLQLVWLHHTEVGVEPLVGREPADDEGEHGDKEDGDQTGEPDPV